MSNWLFALTDLLIASGFIYMIWLLFASTRRGMRNGLTRQRIRVRWGIGTLFGAGAFAHVGAAVGHVTEDLWINILGHGFYAIAVAVCTWLVHHHLTEH